MSTSKRNKTYIILTLALFWIMVPGSCFSLSDTFDWQLGPFLRVDEANPIVRPCPDSIFYCPVQHKNIHWEAEHAFNPGAVVRNGKVYLIYRAEDDYGTGIGNHTSRLGLAESTDGIHFQRSGTPVLFPANDDQNMYEFPGGCEDPRIVETEDGTYVMTYTQWNHQDAVLAVATSVDILHWEKHGYVFKGDWRRRWSKSGSIVCRREGDRLIATKLQGKYWMYWGEGQIHAATSDDLISWKLLKDKDDMPLVVLEPRNGKFDSLLVEAGPPALITEDEIVLLYNGKNSIERGDQRITPHAYSAGQLLLDISNPTKILSRSEKCFLTPERPFEMRGQYEGVTVFIQGLVSFQENWLLYYGTADSAIGVARCKQGTTRKEDTHVHRTQSHDTYKCITSF